jgi:hypothetical protein
MALRRLCWLGKQNIGKKILRKIYEPTYEEGNWELKRIMKYVNSEFKYLDTVSIIKIHRFQLFDHIVRKAGWKIRVGRRGLTRMYDMEVGLK